MRRITMLCAVATVAIATLAAAAPASANPYHLIRFSDTGFCQIWDDGIKTTPWPSNYTPIGTPAPTLIEALAVKEGLLRSGACKF